ncbi:MAG: MBL fold metallo-hydrolase [Gemmatimonadetes bacterium]|nr:MAG: MBL fold metallo-hydrolase [Gemmatimonadota bacterium]
MDIRLRPNEIHPGIYLFTSFKTLMVNSTVVDCGDEVIVVDTLLRKDEATQVADFIRETLQKSVSWIINTHWHKDHLYGNQAYPGVPTIAHENYIHSAEAQKILMGHRMPYQHPKLTFSERMRLTIGTRHMELHGAPGHSPDGLVVYLPEEKVMFTGDTVIGNGSRRIGLPYVHEGNWGRLEATLEWLLTFNIERIAPGHAKPGDKSLIQQRLDYTQRLRRFVQEAPLANMTKADLIALPLTEFTHDGSEAMMPNLHHINLEKMWAELHNNTP